MKLLFPKSIKNNVKKITTLLEKAAASPTLTYDQICKIDYQGLYIIFDDKEILYVGKTNRTGKVRMRELASDFRSHTFNKKLLSKRFKDLGFVFEILKKETKKEWIDKKIITDQTFTEHQNEINQFIKLNLKFKFYKQLDDNRLICLEHFAIAIFNPIYND